MLDTRLQERFTRHCTDAAFGYTAATTAAYAAFADQVFDFWSGMLTSERREAPPAPKFSWGWPLPVPAPRQRPAPNPFMPFTWALPQASQSRSAAADNPYAWPLAGANAAFSAWLGMFPAAAAAPPAAWPMAFMMMASGVPRSVAWPTAEANIAVMDAAEVASASVQQAFASYRSDGGHAVSRQPWPSANIMMMAMLVPLNIGAMLTSMRLA
jgi:hypothetical protein